MYPVSPPSIRSRLASTAFSVIAVTVTSLAIAFVALFFVDQRIRLVHKAEVHATALAGALTAPLVSSDANAALQAMVQWFSVSEARALVVYLIDGQIIAELSRRTNNDGTVQTALEFDEGLRNRFAATHIVQPISLNGERLGSLDLAINFDHLYHQILVLATAMFLLAALVLVIVRVMLKRNTSQELKPLALLSSQMKAVARSHNCSARVNEEGPTEVVNLARSFNKVVDVLHYKAGKLQQELQERTLRETQLDYMAHFDQVTGLPNRVHFQRELVRAVERSKRQKNNFAVVYLDLDNFKIVNDTLGHDKGDQLLCAVGKRLIETVRKADLVCRLGGDEFTIVLEGITSLGTVVDVVSKIIENLAKGYEIDDQMLHIRASAGVALFPEQTSDVRNILRFADLAMYKAKSDGKNSYCVYTSDLITQADERRVIENELRQGIDNNEFFLSYQPQVSIDTGRIEGMEALLRWQHPQRGLIAPGEYIDVAEKSGLIVPLGQKILALACAQWKEWRDQGINPPKIAVNVSSLQLSEESFAEDLMATLATYGHPGSGLELEITESLLLSDTRVSKAMMHRLAGLGIEWSLDDFGTGYSSLTYLTKFPIKKIKIDRSFINNLPGNSNSDAIVTAVVALARGLDMRVVAEGVETRQHVEYLATMGGIIAQGYYYHYPLSPPEMTRLLLDSVV